MNNSNTIIGFDMNCKLVKVKGGVFKKIKIKF